MTINITYIIYVRCVFLCSTMNWRINYEAINTVTVHEVNENDSYEICGKKSHYYIHKHLLMFHSLTTMLFIASLDMTNTLPSMCNTLLCPGRMFLPHCQSLESLVLKKEVDIISRKTWWINEEFARGPRSPTLEEGMRAAMGATDECCAGPYA